MTAPGISAAAAAPQDLVVQAQPSGTSPKEAAKQFEGMLMANLFQQLRKTVHTSSLFGGDGSATQTYEYLLDQAVVNHAIEGGRTWGLSGKLEGSLTRAKAK